MKTIAGRLAAALLGVPILVFTAIEAYFQSFGFYKEHYLIPKEKYGILTPLRWQDIAFLAIFWPMAAAAFYLSYRLLRYALRPRLPGTAIS